jgi:predicted amidohydrolase
LRIAALQHRLRAHERMDLASMLAQSEHAAERGVQVLAFPRVPGLVADRVLLDAFFRNVEERAPGVGLIRPRLRHAGEGPLRPQATALGRTLVLDGDDCIDPALFAAVQDAECDSLVWLFNAEDPLQAEAALELALDASLHLAPLVVIATVTGHARGVLAAGIGAIVHLGEILAEGGEGEELVVADVPSPAGFSEKPRSLPDPAPILMQRLAAHHAAGLR